MLDKTTVDKVCRTSDYARAVVHPFYDPWSEHCMLKLHAVQQDRRSAASGVNASYGY